MPAPDAHGAGNETGAISQTATRLRIHSNQRLGYYGVMNTPDLTELRRFAESLADCARSTTMKWFRRPLDIETKDDRSPVTIADQETERRLRAMVKEHYPAHGFIGEEFDDDNSDCELAWIVDPIDGTQQFIAGMPLFGTLIGLLHEGRPIVGVVDVPAMHERWVGVRGRQTLLNGNTCNSSAEHELVNASIFTTSPDIFTPSQWQTFDQFSLQCRARRFGLDCYAYALLSAGHVEIVMESGLKSFDILPLVPVIEGAGGRITDWQGHELTIDRCDQALAVANDALHVSAIDALSAIAGKSHR